ncbi:MAG TPA: dockerin type I domain-containing protein, partial [Clostridia bacterium]
EEIGALAQAFEYGIIPGKPQTVTGSFSSNAITVTCTHNGKSISFKCSIQYPGTGKAPYPAMIGVGMNTLNTSEILKLGVALITLPCDEIGQQTDGSSRGKGKFFDLYGSNYDAGAIAAWVWGASRLIDAIEITPSANIDAKRLAVTGGSRLGKGALAVGAFDDRIALTIPQECGCGGVGSWRVADWMGSSVQTLSEINWENCWFSNSLNQFRGQTNKLPIDQHEVMGMCAPRALLVIENTSMIWLGNKSTYTCSQSAHMIYEALGIPDRMGFSQVGHPTHLEFVAAQQPEVTAYIQKFLVGGGTGNTNVNKTDGGFTLDKAKWIDWTVPTLTGTLPGPGNNNPTPTPTDPKIVYGDVNEDGKVNSNDCSIMKRYLLEMITTFQSDNAKKAADVNKDGKINSTDYSAMKRIVLEITT